MKTILVTGGAGFIGSNFVRFALGADPEIRIINLDLLTYAGSLENLRELPDPHRHTFIRGNICDRKLVEGLLRRHRIDAIVHFAAETHVDRSIRGPAPFILTNVMGTFSLLEAARQVWLVEHRPSNRAFRFHHVSTDEVYGSLENGEPPFTEQSPYRPNSPYAASKAASDHLVRSYAHTYDLPISITNCSNNYGPFQFPEKIIPLMILCAIDGKPMPLYGDGKHIRDWLFVEDHCEAIWRVLVEGEAGAIYNLGGGQERSNLELVNLLCDILDQMLPDPLHTPYERLIEFVSDRPGHDRRYAMDISKIQSELGWEPKESLETGLKKTIAWYIEHLDWLKTIRSQRNYQGWLQENYSFQGANP